MKQKNRTVEEAAKSKATAEAIQKAQQIRRTQYGQRILDTICDKVVETNGLGHIGWAIGKTDVVVDFVAQILGRTRRSVAGALSHLIDAGLIKNGGRNERTWKERGDIVGISHNGWIAFSRWDEARLIAHWGDGGPGEPISVEEWLDWDGNEGTSSPYDAPMAFPY